MSEQPLDFDGENDPDYDHGESVTKKQEPILFPGVDATEISDWKTINVFVKESGALDYYNTVYSITRQLSRGGRATPKAFQGKPWQDSWWGPEQFKPKQVEAYLAKYNVFPDHKAIQRTFANLVRENVLVHATEETDDGERSVKNLFQAANAML